MPQNGPQIANICTNCGLRIGQVGSVTQWIFNDDRCTCGSAAEPAVDEAAAAEDAVEQQLRELLGAHIDDRYRVDAIIGVGGWGCVVQAWHPQLECPVAIKLLHPHLSFDSEKVARFKQEAQAARRLRHPNIVPVQDYGHWNGRPYLVMDLLQGHSLSREIAEKTLTTESFFDIFSQVAAGLAAAHDAGIVHRDLTPSNIFIVDDAPENSKVKILDFGLAKLTSTEGETIASLTQTGMTLGTPAYMSPEHCLGETTDARSDIYSMGCCMYEALSGRKVFDEDTVYGLMNAHVSSIPRPVVTEKNSDVLPLKDLIERCLEKDPACRPQSAHQVMAALHNLRAGEKSGLSRRRKSVLPNQRQLNRSMAFNVATLTAVFATTIVLGMAFSVPITKNLSFELPKMQDKLVLMLPLKREWKRFDLRGTQLMNDGQYKEADEQFAVAESTAQANGNREQQLRSLQRRALVAQILNDRDKYNARVQQIEQLKQQSGDVKQRQVAEAEMARQALSFVADHPSADQIPHLRKLIDSMVSAAVVLQQRGEDSQVVALLEPAEAKAKSTFGELDPTYAECLVRLSYSKLRNSHTTNWADLRYSDTRELTPQARQQLIESLPKASAVLGPREKELAQEANLVLAEAMLPVNLPKALELAQAVASLPDDQISRRMQLKAQYVKSKCLVRLRRPGEATQTLEQLIEPIARLCPEDLAGCMSEYRSVYFCGQPFDQHALAKKAEGLEAANPLLALNLYLISLTRMGDNAKLAVSLSEKALALAQYESEPTSMLTDMALDYRVRALTENNQRVLTEPLLRQLLAVRELNDRSERELRDTRTWLACVQMEKGDSMSAKKQFELLANNYQTAPYASMWELSDYFSDLAGRFATPTERTVLLERLRARIDALADKSAPAINAGRLDDFGRLQFELGRKEEALKTFHEAAALLERRGPLPRKNVVQLRGVLKDLVFYERAAGHTAEADQNKALMDEVAAGTFKFGHHW